MTFKFKKYHGAGNDFIFIDNRDRFFKHYDSHSIEQLCNRRFGIGADGLILIQNHYDYDFEMVYFNANGKVGSMCGNGGRCAVAFAQSLRIIKDKAYFKAIDGGHVAYLEDDFVSLQMKDVLKVDILADDTYFLDTGSPHHVQFVKNLQSLDVYEEGRKIRYNDQYKEKGTNVNFVEIQPDGSLFVRTYERGVEDETYSCGTGVTASAIALNKLKGSPNNPLSIQTKGGPMQVGYKEEDGIFKDIFLSGPAVKVFEGSFRM